MSFEHRTYTVSHSRKVNETKIFDELRKYFQQPLLISRVTELGVLCATSISRSSRSLWESVLSRERLTFKKKSKRVMKTKGESMVVDQNFETLRSNDQNLWHKFILLFLFFYLLYLLIIFILFYYFISSIYLYLHKDLKLPTFSAFVVVPARQKFLSQVETDMFNFLSINLT